MEIKNRNLYKLNKSIHRDFGYFFFFLTIIYCISGLALNHHSDWNPDFEVHRKEVKLNLPSNITEINNALIKAELSKINENDNYLMYDAPSPDKIKLYFKDGSLLLDLSTGKGELERVKKRALIFESNWLHRNPGGIWTIISDVFAISLILLSLTGLFILKGQKGLKGRGKWLVGSGIVMTILIFFIMSI